MEHEKTKQKITKTTEVDLRRRMSEFKVVDLSTKVSRCQGKTFTDNKRRNKS